jgi:uncharacterized protein (DUF342 family)
MAEEEEKETYFGYHFKIAEHGMAVVASAVDKPGSGVASSFEEALKVLENIGVRHGVDEEELKAMIEERRIVSEFKVAKGTKSIPGEDGSLKFHIDLDTKPKFIPDPDATKVNYRESMRTVFLEKGDCIAEIVPPTKGQEGKSVRGETIAATPGMPFKAVAGEGVEQKGNEFLADISGTPSEKAGMIMVKQVYEIEGDVDLSVGNINFPGSVIIGGDVQDDFEIMAGGDVIVKGVVGAAKVRSQGNIQIFGGILGRDKAEIRSNGNIEALFVSNATLVSEKNIAITKDISQSQIFAGIKVQCGASIVGGRTVAILEVEAGELGNETGTKTNVEVRRSLKLIKLQDSNEELLQEANALSENLKSFVHLSDLSDEQLEAAWKMKEEVAGLIMRKKNLDVQIERVEKKLSELEDVRIVINKVLHADVYMSAPYCTAHIVSTTKGKQIVTENIENGQMQVRHG